MHLLQAVLCYARPAASSKQHPAATNNRSAASTGTATLAALCLVQVDSELTPICPAGFYCCWAADCALPVRDTAYQDPAGCQSLCGLQGRIFYYLLIMGWSLREHEVNLDFEQVSSYALATALPKLAGLQYALAADEYHEPSKLG